MFKKMLF